MTAQHTPGPWARVDDSFEIRTHDGERYITTILGPHDTQDEANARLIAAAPLMLEALRDALEELETLISADQKDTLRDPITDSTTDERVVRIRAAIRAATGEDA